MHPSERNYIPGRQLKAKVEDRKERFEGLNQFVRARGGWLVSVPGERTVAMECLPDSKLPDDLSDLGYVVEQTGVGERIQGSAVTERFGRRSDGELVPLTPGSMPGSRACCGSSSTSVNRTSWRTDQLPLNI